MIYDFRKVFIRMPSLEDNIIVCDDRKKGVDFILHSILPYYSHEEIFKFVSSKNEYRVIMKNKQQFIVYVDKGNFCGMRCNRLFWFSGIKKSHLEEIYTELLIRCKNGYPCQTVEVFDSDIWEVKYYI